MKPKDGSPPSVVQAADPEEPLLIEEEDPGALVELARTSLDPESGDKFSKDVKPFKPPAASSAAASQEQESEEEKHWIEIELVDEDGEPVPGERYEVELPDGSVAGGSLDQNGKARIEGFDPGQCKVTFPDLDKETWEPE